MSNFLCHHISSYKNRYNNHENNTKLGLKIHHHIKSIFHKMWLNFTFYINHTLLARTLPLLRALWLDKSSGDELASFKFMSSLSPFAFLLLDFMGVDFSPFSCLVVDFSPFSCLAVDFSPFSCLVVDFSTFSCLVVDFFRFTCLAVDFSGVGPGVGVLTPLLCCSGCLELLRAFSNHLLTCQVIFINNTQNIINYTWNKRNIVIKLYK